MGTHGVERWVKSLADLLILSLLRRKPMCGYALIASIHTKYGIMLSPGTVYSLLRSMEEDGLIKGKTSGKSREGRIYDLTTRGRVKFRKLLSKFVDTHRVVITDLIRGGGEKSTGR